MSCWFGKLICIVISCFSDQKVSLSQLSNLINYIKNPKINSHPVSTKFSGAYLANNGFSIITKAKSIKRLLLLFDR